MCCLQAWWLHSKETDHGVVWTLPTAHRRTMQYFNDKELPCGKICMDLFPVVNTRSPSGSVVNIPYVRSTLRTKIRLLLFAIWVLHFSKSLHNTVRSIYPMDILSEVPHPYVTVAELCNCHFTRVSCHSAFHCALNLTHCFSWNASA